MDKRSTSHMTSGGGNLSKALFPTFFIFHMDRRTHLFLLFPLHLLGNLSSAATQRTEDTSEFVSLLLPSNNVYLSYWIPEERTKRCWFLGRGLFTLKRLFLNFCLGEIISLTSSQQAAPISPLSKVKALHWV